ncbi:YeeE/YedE family protein [Trueperella pyogenes]|uniref:YeeE/YedE family protein n=1 Tax=Trueperella pyogenes TaxID=1661 RepID=UPI00345CE84B
MILTGLLVGAIFGFVLQRGRFCITGAFRDVWVSKSTWWIGAVFVAIAVQAIGLAVFNTTGFLPTYTVAKEFAPFATVVGGFIFGVGMLLAGGCATGTYYRAGEGLVGSWFALVFYALSAAVFSHGPLKEVTASVRNWGVTKDATIDQTLGVSPWVLVGILSLATAYWAYRNLTRPKLPLAVLPAEKTGLAHVLFEKPWNPYVTGAVIGIIALVAWPLSWATGRQWGLGITGPSANLVTYLSTGNVEAVDWGVFLILGIFAGSFIAAKASGEFKVRVPSADVVVKSILGGAMMGWGARWAGGCTIGNGLVETSMFSWQGWVSLLAMLAGAGVASRIFIIQRKQLVNA